VSLDRVNNEPYIVVHQWMLAFTKHECAAALICLFDYVHDANLEKRDQADRLKIFFDNDGKPVKTSRTFLQCHSLADLKRRLPIFGQTSIQEGIKILKQLGVIKIFRNPSKKQAFDRRQYFLYRPEVIEKFLSTYRKISEPEPETLEDFLELEEEPEETISPIKSTSVKNNKSSVKNNNACVENNRPSNENNRPSNENTTCNSYNLIHNQTNNVRERFLTDNAPKGDVVALDPAPSQNLFSELKEPINENQALTVKSSSETLTLRDKQNNMFGMYREVCKCSPTGQDARTLNEMASAGFDPEIVKLIIVDLASRVGTGTGHFAPSLNEVKKMYPIYAARLANNIEPKAHEKATTLEKNIDGFARSMARINELRAKAKKGDK